MWLYSLRRRSLLKRRLIFERGVRVGTGVLQSYAKCGPSLHVCSIVPPKLRLQNALRAINISLLFLISSVQFLTESRASLIGKQVLRRGFILTVAMVAKGDKCAARYLLLFLNIYVNLIDKFA